MRRLLVTAFCAALVAAPVGSSSWGAPRPKPTLALVKTAPVTVAGKHFKALERIRLRLLASGSTFVESARARSTGSFTAVFDDVPVVLDRCAGDWVILVTGSGGSRATLSPQQAKAPLPACPPPP